MTLRGNLLPLIELGPKLLGRFDLTLYDVMMRVKTWSGERVGMGTKTVVDTDITHSNGARVEVKRLTTKDILASGGAYHDGDYEIGPIAPAFVKNGVPGGHDTDFFEPPVGVNPAEVLFRLTGPGMENGVWFKKVKTFMDDPFAYKFVVSRNNVSQEQ